jgi:hypothetical protein
MLDGVERGSNVPDNHNGADRISQDLIRPSDERSTYP